MTFEKIEQKKSKNKPETREAVFEKLVEKHQKKLVSIACRMLGSVEDARDAVQEAFVRLWKSENWQTRTQEIFPLLSKILINRCIDVLRKRAVQRFFRLTKQQANQLKISESNIERDANRREFRELLESAMSRLKPKQKAIFSPRDIEGFSVKETAEISLKKLNKHL